MTFAPVLNLSTLNGLNGFVIDGISAEDNSGFSVSGAGDVNGDGLDDLIIGAPNATSNSNTNAGESYVVFGSSTGFAASINPTFLNGSNGFVINGVAANDYSGVSVSGAGDVNGDGLDDLIVGAPYANFNGGSNAGESYVVFGSSTGFGVRVDLATLDGSNGFAINGTDEGDYSGRSVSGVGDINGDGFDDVIIGAEGSAANGNSDAGESYVVFGSDTGFSARVDLTTLDGRNGFVINGIDEGDYSGRSVSGAGDINGDGIDDLVVGAWFASPNGEAYAGESYVVFGSNTGFGSSLNLATLNGSNGFVINGINAEDYSGVSVSGAGDINGDGIDDLIVGADFATANGNARAGESYVVFGSDAGFSASLDLATLNGSNGFVINGIDVGDNSGRSVSGAGDVNGDGIDDLIIGAPDATVSDNAFAGESYVVFGSDNGFGASLDLVMLDGNNGFVINGTDVGNNFGSSVSGAGDINGDGINDFIIGSPDAAANGNELAGQSYVVFGRRDSSVSFLSLELARQLPGTFVSELPYTPVEVGGINLGQFFDMTYYLHHNPDVATAAASGLISSGFDHFVQFGLTEGRNSNPLFDEQAYRATNSDVVTAISNGSFESGLQHFFLFGHLEGRNPSQFFDQSDYLTANPDVAAAVEAGIFSSAFEHYIEAGAQEGRSPDLSFFQEDFYLAQNADIADAVQAGVFVDGFEHFAQFGALEGRDPSSLFSNDAYLAAHSDIAAAVAQGTIPSGFFHYSVFGAAEGRSLA